ncbi:Retrovirus-related Pol polyprotein from transposon gypsy [Hypsizygus marmoreus]|uniref:Retrovirus-related Pol polyprotein from transposon gypsy n=1 Tax=Hypsizygus marmoreus TaxID=39966 RepID=A0A369JSA7_HYPMA|nr:Retrovirus-related Pol polyprotein from transposon gypsy [Hypsizygus marmoreus]
MYLWKSVKYTNVLPCWVNDYRILNKVTVPDNYPLPRVHDILADCAKGVIWGKIDMTNSFFQMLVHPDHIKYTAILTPFGLWEWEQIGKICHIYLDDIIIWSNSIAEYKINIATLHCPPILLRHQMSLFCTEIDFLGHHISAHGVETDTSKVEKILNSSYKEPQVIAPIWSITSDKSLFDDIKLGYTEDPWTKSLLHDIEHDLILPSSGITLVNNLLFIGDCLVVPKYAGLRENLFCLAHNNLSHFGGNKSYATLRAL